MNYIIIYVLILLNIFSFLLGYLYGKLNNIGYHQNINSNNKKNKKITTNSDITIDDKTVVVSIDTKGFEKKYTELGDTKIMQTDISESVNKLKNLKG